MNYHLLIGDKSVWLNMKALDALSKTIETAKQSQFKEGDFLRFEGDYDLVTVFAAYTGDGNWHEHASISLGSMELQTGLHITANDCEGYKVRLANEQEKKLLLLALKDAGYKWNAETKKVEVAKKSDEEKEIGRYYYFECENELAYIAKLNDIAGGDTYVFGESIAWNPRRIDIASAEYSNITMVFKKKSCTDMCPATRAEILTLEKLRATYRDESFNTFDRVLVRDSKEEGWKPAFFVKISNSKKLPYNCISLNSGQNSSYKYCIPYEGNEKLAFKTDDVSF